MPLNGWDAVGAISSRLMIRAPHEVLGPIPFKPQFGIRVMAYQKPGFLVSLPQISADNLCNLSVSIILE